MEQSVLSEQRGEPFRNRVRSAKRLALKISRMALRRSQEAKAGYRAAYERLLEVGKPRQGKPDGSGPSSGSRPPPGSSQRRSPFCELLEWAVGQARRRVLEGSGFRRAELLSLFEEHTAIIGRGKARRQTEFGRKVWLSEVEGGIVSGFRILEGNASDEPSSSRPSTTTCACSGGRPDSWQRTAASIPKRTNG